MIRAYAPSCAPLRTGHGCPALPLWAPQVMRALRSRMTTDNGPHRGQAPIVATPRATPTTHSTTEGEKR